MRKYVFVFVALIALLLAGNAQPAFAHGTVTVPGQTYTAANVRKWIVAAMALMAVLLLRFKRKSAPEPIGIRLFSIPGNAAGAVRLATRTIGLLVFVGLLLLAYFGTSKDPFGLAVRSVTLFLIGLPLVSVVLGDAWTAFAPWLASSTMRMEDNAPQRPVAQGIGLLAFFLAWICYLNSHTSESVAWILLVYGVAMLGLRALGDENTVRKYDPFTGYFSTLAYCSPLHVDDTGAVRLNWPGTRLVSLHALRFIPLFVTVSVLLFEGAQDQPTWVNWGNSTNELIVFLKRGGAVVGIGLCVAAIMSATAALSSYFSGHSFKQGLSWIAPALAPLTIAFVIAHDLYPLVQALQDQLFTAWDPLGKGWKPFGATSQGVNVNLIGSYLGTVQVVALIGGALWAMLISRDAMQRDGVNKAAAAMPVFLGIAGLSLFAVAWMVPN